MEVIDVKEFESDFVIYFGGEPKRINAYTLASSLVSIADAIKEANSFVNPGYDVEVVVEAFGEGSFKAKIKTLYQGASNLFSSENLKAIVLGVIAAYVYQHTLSPNEKVDVIVKTNEVVIEQGDNRIIVPRDVHDYMKEVGKSEKFTHSIGKIFEVVERDKNIKSIGFTPNYGDKTPIICIPRERFSLLSEPSKNDGDKREIVETADLQIVKAVLDRGARKWEFVWRGIKISAPVLDQKFYDDFFAHRITIAPGDSIEVKLKIHQLRDKDIGIFTNDRYEIIEVMRHIPRMKQATMHG